MTPMLPQFLSVALPIVMAIWLAALAQNKRLDEISKRLDDVVARLARIEEKLSDHSERIARLEVRR